MSIFSIGKALLGNRKAKNQRQKINSMEDVNQGLYQQNFNDIAGYYRPYEAPGQNALARLDRFAGGDQSVFMASPDYEFRRGEGMRGLERSAAARGGAFSGNALRALNQYNSNLASGEMNNWWNRNMGLVNLAGQATGNIANARAALTGQLTGSNQIKGGASAAEVGAKYNNYTGVVNDIETNLSRLLGRYGV